MSSDPHIARRDDILDALPADGALPPPITYPPPRRVALPFPLHPNFWWSLLWCLGMLICTQGVGGAIAVVVIFAIALVNPEAAPLDKMGDASNLMSLPSFQFAIGLGLWLAHALMIALSLGVLRIVAGRSWAREVAVRRPALLHVGLVILVVPTFSLLANGAYAVTEKLGIPGVSDLFQTAAFLSAICLSLFVLGMVALFLRLSFGDDWSLRLWSLSPVGYSAVLLLTFLGLVAGLYQVVTYLGVAVVPKVISPKETGGMEEMMKMIAGWPLPLAVFLIAVMPGFSEELWCRAFLGRGLVGKHGYFWGILTTSFLFGIIHLDPRQGTMAAVLGIALHYVYVMTRSLWMPMLLHFLNNGLAVVLSRQSGALANLENNVTDFPVAFFVSAGLLMTAVLWTFYQTRARLVAPEGVTPWEPPHPGVACPPAESLTIVHSPRISLVNALAVLVALAAFVASFVMAVM